MSAQAGQLMGAAERQRQRHPPTVAVQAQAHDVAAAQPRGGVKRAPLGQVADRAVGLAGGASEHADRAARQPQQAQQRLEQRRLAGSVGAQERDELALAHAQVELAPHGAPAERNRGVAHLDRRRGGARRLRGARLGGPL